MSNEKGTMTEDEAVKAIVDSLRNATKTNIIPHPNRIFCVDLPVKAVQLSSGIQLATSFENLGAKKGQEKLLRRYFIAAIGDMVKELTFNGKKAEIGDEMIYCDIPDAIKLEIPRVTDFDLLDRQRKHRTFVSFDAGEIHGILKH